MVLFRAQVGFLEKPGKHGHSRAEVSVRFVAARGSEPGAEAQQPLACDGGRRAVRWLVLVEWISGSVTPRTQLRQAGRAGVPVRDAIKGGIGDVEIRRHSDGLRENHKDFFFPAERRELSIRPGSRGTPAPPRTRGLPRQGRGSTC